MSTNYEWQKHQVNERIRDRMQEADAWRKAGRKARRTGREAGMRKLILAATAAVLAVLVLLQSAIL